MKKITPESHKDKRGGKRPNAGRPPASNKKAFRAIYVYREVFDAIPPGVNKCTLTSSLLSDWLKQNDV